MVERWNKLNVENEDQELLEDYNCVLSDISITNGEDNNKTDDDEKEYCHVNMELCLPSKDNDGLIHAIVKRHKLDGEGKAVGISWQNPMKKDTVKLF